MIAYVDSSVVLRLVLSEPDPLVEWEALVEGVTSHVAFVENAVGACTARTQRAE